MSTTEEAILATIEENDSPDNTNEPTDLQVTQEAGSGQETNTEQSSNDESAGSQQNVPAVSGGNTGEGTKDGSGPDGGQSIATRAASTGRVAAQDARGNLVDSGGNIVVKAGAERRLYERGTRLQQELTTAQQQVQTLSNQVAQNNALDGQVRQYGLQPTEVTTGLELVAQFKRDPVAVVKTLLQEVQAMGHTIEGIGSGIDAAAIKRMVAQEIAPIKQSQQTTAQEAIALDNARKELNAFYGNYPDAPVQEDILNSMLQADPKLNLETAYLRLSNWALTVGLDIKLPIQAQIDALNQSGNTNQQQTNGGAQQQPQPMPNGQAQVTTSIESSENFADPETSYREIIREALKDSGMTTLR